MRHGEKHLVGRHERRRTAFPPAAAAWPSPTSPGLNHVTLLFEEKPARGRIRQDPDEEEEKRRRGSAGQRRRRGRGAGKEEKERGGSREQERRRGEAWGVGIEDRRGLVARFSPALTAHRTKRTLRFLLSVTANWARGQRRPTHHPLEHESITCRKTNAWIFDSGVRTCQQGRSCEPDSPRDADASGMRVA